MHRTDTRGAIGAIFLFIFASAMTAAALLAYGGTTIGYGPPAYVVEPGAFENVSVSAASWLVFDAETGEVFGAHAADTPRPVASVTKLLTALVAADTLTEGATTTISWRAVATEGRAGGLTAGETLSVGELLFPLLIESSNDAAEALAEAAGRADFIATMNARARDLGMASASFADPSGLSGGNRASAADIMRLVRYFYASEERLLHLTRLPEYQSGGHHWRNVNPAVRMAGFAGGKNGFTDEAGRTLAAVFEERLGADSARPIGIALLGSTDLAADVAALREEVRASVRYEERGQ